MKYGLFWTTVRSIGYKCVYSVEAWNIVTLSVSVMKSMLIPYESYFKNNYCEGKGGGLLKNYFPHNLIYHCPLKI